MCGRHYASYTDEELFLEYGNKKDWNWPLADQKILYSPSFNTCPTQESPVLRLQEGLLQFQSMRWGLVPSWAASVKAADKYSMINARAETISEKKSFKEAFANGRCILPLSGFFEWKREDSQKQPYAIYLEKEAIMSVAAIYEVWSGEKEQLYSYAIVTTEANEFMQNIHQRMPVILSAADQHAWLDPQSDEDLLESCMRSDAPIGLVAHPISQAVNSPKNNSADLLRPLPEQKILM